MILEDYKLIFVTVGLIGVFLIVTPAVVSAFHLSTADPFSELYVLGPDHKVQNYPFDVLNLQNFTLYLGASNHLGSSAYYALFMKLRNETDLLPNAAHGVPSPLPILSEFRFSLQDGQKWAEPLTFSFSGIVISGNNSLVTRVNINERSYAVNKSGAFNSYSKTFYYEFIFELWRYDLHLSQFVFDNRFVTIQLSVKS